MVAIGSGSPTRSAWGHSNEPALVTKAARQLGPSAFEDLTIRRSVDVPTARLGIGSVNRAADPVSVHERAAPEAE